MLSVFQEVSPDEGFRREAETSIKQYVVLVVLEKLI